MVNSKTVALVAGGLVVGLVVGYGLGRVSLGPDSSLSNGTYQEGYDAARVKLREANVFPPNPTEASILSGQVKSVGDDSIVFSPNLRSPNPLEPLNLPADRTVTLAADAQVTRQVPLDPDEFQKLVAEFQKAVNSGQPSPPPSSFKTESIAFQDLKVGDLITVEADHNILSETAFAATSVVVNGSAAAPTAPPPTP